MLFPDGASPITRISDAVKGGLATCGDTSRSVLALYQEHAGAFQRIRDLAGGGATEAELRSASEQVPTEVAWRGAALQSQLHGQALSVILSCCFCIEAYANTLAHYLFGEADYLQLISMGRAASTDALTASFEEMSIRDKWRRLDSLGPGGAFSEDREPYQGFNILFRFRDDCVHGKVVGLGEAVAGKRYGGKLPSPITGSLTLTHALFAADVYWDMVLGVHQLLATDHNQFHRHYNLTPWGDQTVRKQLTELATAYRRSLG